MKNILFILSLFLLTSCVIDGLEVDDKRKTEITKEESK